MQQDSQQKAQLAQYQDELARKRMETEHEKQRQRNAELVSMQVRAASWGPRNGVQRTTTSALLLALAEPWLDVPSWLVCCCGCVQSFGGLPPLAPAHLHTSRVAAARSLSPISLLQEESGKRTEMEKAAIAQQIEAERRATEKYKASLEKEVQRERALAEAEGRAEERRRNKDIYRE